MTTHKDQQPERPNYKQEFVALAEEIKRVHLRPDGKRYRNEDIAKDLGYTRNYLGQLLGKNGVVTEDHLKHLQEIFSKEAGRKEPKAPTLQPERPPQERPVTPPPKPVPQLRTPVPPPVRAEPEPKSMTPPPTPAPKPEPAQVEPKKPALVPPIPPQPPKPSGYQEAYIQILLERIEELRGDKEQLRQDKEELRRLNSYLQKRLEEVEAVLRDV